MTDESTQHSAVAGQNASCDATGAGGDSPLAPLPRQGVANRPRKARTMFSSIARWSALPSLLFLGAMVLPSTLQGQRAPAAERDNPAALASTGIANSRLVTTTTRARTAETSIMTTGESLAAVMDPDLPFSDPLLVPFGHTMQMPASPSALSMVPKQDDGVHVGANLAMVGVGAAALVVGLVMDNDAGTIIAVGGGVVALIGFYRWLR